jgi:serine/threonine protein phosphatase 1
MSKCKGYRRNLVGCDKFCFLKFNIHNATGGMGRKFVIGDIHGAYRALRQCLERSAFDYEHDQLISLGDVCDGWPETKASVEELLRIKNLIYLLGNHDWWTLQWMLTGKIEELWYSQGGKATIDSYKDGIPEHHITFLSDALLHYIDENRLFVHAGIDPLRPLEQQDKHIFLWDRNLAALALDLYGNPRQRKLSSFGEIYLGHTPIPFPAPINSLEVWLMDTGAGWSGVLSIMNIDTKEVFTSDPVPRLYPGVEGRKKKL